MIRTFNVKRWLLEICLCRNKILQGRSGSSCGILFVKFKCTNVNEKNVYLFRFHRILCPWFIFGHMSQSNREMGRHCYVKKEQMTVQNVNFLGCRSACPLWVDKGSDWFVVNIPWPATALVTIAEFVEPRLCCTFVSCFRIKCSVDVGSCSA